MLILERPWTRQPPPGTKARGPGSVWAFNPGGLLADSAGSVHGTLMNAPQWITSGNQTGLKFTSSSAQYVDFGTGINLSETSRPWTFAIVAKIDSPALNFVFGTTASSGTFRGTQFYCNSNTIALELDDGAAYHYKVSNINVVDGITHTIVGTYDGSNTVGGLKIYIDGAESGYSTNTSSGTVSNISSGNTVSLGARQWSGGPGYASMTVEYAEYWPRALAAAEARAIHVNRWRLFHRRIYIPTAAAASGVPTLSASTYVPGSLTSTGWQPRVTAS